MATTELRTLRIAPEIDATKYTAGAQQKVAADKAMAASNREVAATATDTSTKISQAGDVLARLSRQYVDGYASAQRFNSALNTLSRGIDAGKIKMSEAGAILDGIYKKYGLMAEASQFAAKGQTELATAITAANAKLAAQKQIAPANVNRGTNFAALNATSQFQDIAITSAMGQSPLTIALQQGTQLGQGLQMALGEQGAAGAAKVLGSAVLGLFTPINLVAIGLTAVVAAGIQFGSKLFPQVKSLDDLLKEQTETVKALGNAYGDVAEKAKMAANSSLAGFGLSSSSTVGGLRLSIADQVRSITSETGRFINPGKSAGGFYDIAGEFKPFADAIEHLRDTAAKGTPDVLGFKRMVEERWALDPNNAALTKAGAKLEEFAAKSVDAAHALQQLQIIQKQLFNDVGPNGFLLSQGTSNRADMGNLALFRSQQQVSADRARQAFAAQTQANVARSPEELAAAARAQAQATYVSGESDEERNLRVGLAGKRALIDAENALKQAQIERYRALDQAAASQQLELNLIGKTTGEAARMRFEFERIQQLREEAAKNHTLVDPAEVERIKAAADAAGKLADTIARANLGRDLQFERDQVFRSSGDQTIASRLHGAGLPVDLNSPEAQMMRETQRIQDLRDGIKGFFSDFREGLLNGKKFGEAFGDALLNALNKRADQMADKALDALSSVLANALGIGGGSNSSAMGAAGVVGSILGVANDNSQTYAAPAGKVTRAPLADIGSTIFKAAGMTKGGIPLSQIGAQGLTARVNAEYAGRFQGLLDDLTSAGYKITSLGEGGYSFRNVAGSKNLSNHAFGNALDINPRSNPWTFGRNPDGSVITDLPSNINEIAQRNGLFWGGNWNKADTMHFQVDKTIQSVDKLGTSSIDTANALQGGLGKLGSTLSQAPAVASGGGGGGLFGWLGSLFGGGTTKYASEILSGARVGLFADGTENAPPGWAWVGERGPELMKMRGGEVIRNNQRSMQMAANSNGGPHVVVPTVRIFMDEDGKWQNRVEKISQGPAQQESRKAVGGYAYQQRNGGAARDDHYYQRLKRRA